jgi:peptide/nickel transport system ATP-binding protein
MSGTDNGTVLAVRDVTVRFEGDEGAVHAVDRVSFDVTRGEVLAIVGESGCGKSVTTMSLLGLLPPTASVEGSARFNGGKELIGAGEGELRKIRGREISFVFQDPMTSLNPVFTVERQVGEVLRRHLGLCRRRRRASGRSSCSTSSGSRAPSGASTSTRTSCRAACASG